MFDTTVLNETTTRIDVKKEAQQQILAIKKESTNSFIIHCYVNDEIWKGLFYERPFLNKYMQTKANVSPRHFKDERLESYEKMHWLSDEENKRQKKQFNDATEKLLAEQAIEVLQVKILDKTGQALVEIRWTNG